MPSIARIVLIACVLLASGGVGLTAQDRPRVTVSRRALRVAFPVDTTQQFGWPDQPATRNAPGYSWSVLIHGLDEPYWIGFDARRDTTARAFRSFAELLRAGRAIQCVGGMVVQCDHTRVSASSRGDSIIVVLRDPARISRLFGLRQPLVSFTVQRPEEPYFSRDDAVRVHYVAPQIPSPTANTRATWARARREYEARINSYERTIGTEGHMSRWWTQLWLQAGDSMAVRVVEIHCIHDVCTETRPAPTAARWSIGDSSVARLQPTETRAGVYQASPASPYYVKALRPGRTVIHVHGVHGPSDSAASSTRPKRELKRELVVTGAVSSVRFLRKPDTVQVRESFTLDVRAFDATGQELSGIPIELHYVNRGLNFGGLAAARSPLRLDAPGLTQVVARVKQLADTAAIVVVDSARTR
jgi:hypothetical protein